MSSTETSPADTETPAGMTALVIPEDVWILNILDYLDSLALSRLARACRTLRDHTDAYRNSCAYGRSLALAGLRRVHSLLVARHTKCAGQFSLADLTKSVGAYTTRLYVSYHDLPAAAAARRAPPEEEPGRCHELSCRSRQIAAAMIAHAQARELVKLWGRAEIAAFLVPFATQVGSDWCDSSAAIAWALWALDLAILRRVIFAPDPCAVLAEEAKSPEQEVIALAIKHSLKVVPKFGRYHYVRAINTSKKAGHLRAIGSASEAVLKSLGLIGPAGQVSALEDFRCDLSAPDSDDIGALLAAILAFGPGGGPPAAVMVGPSGAAIPMPSAMLAALLMGPGAFGGGGDGNSDDGNSDDGNSDDGNSDDEDGPPPPRPRGLPPGLHPDEFPGMPPRPFAPENVIVVNGTLADHDFSPPGPRPTRPPPTS